MSLFNSISMPWNFTLFFSNFSCESEVRSPILNSSTISWYRGLCCPVLNWETKEWLRGAIKITFLSRLSFIISDNLLNSFSIWTVGSSVHSTISNLLCSCLKAIKASSSSRSKFFRLTKIKLPCALYALISFIIWLTFMLPRKVCVGSVM